jgi:hypothetical protein
MGKVYAVLDIDQDYSLIGIIPNKEILKCFKKQRDMKQYKIEKVDADEIEEYLREIDINAVLVSGVVMFPDEFEYFSMSFDQMILDINSTLKNLFEGILPFLKLKDDEYTTVLEFISMVIHHLNEYSNRFKYEISPDEDSPEDIFFNLGKMAFKIIGRNVSE